MEEKIEIAVGDVVQIHPSHDEAFGGCFMVVSEVKTWGVQGYVTVPGSGGQAYYRCPWKAFVRIGKAEWVQAEA